MHEDLLARLDEIEAEMKKIGFWIDAENHKPVSPEFEAWLQKIFLPNARAAIQTDDLPSTSQVGLMALRQYDYHSHIPEAENLVALLSRFDRMVESRAPSSPR